MPTLKKIGRVYFPDGTSQELFQEVFHRELYFKSLDGFTHITPEWHDKIWKYQFGDSYMDGGWNYNVEGGVH